MSLPGPWNVTCKLFKAAYAPRGERLMLLEVRSEIADFGPSRTLGFVVILYALWPTLNNTVYFKINWHVEFRQLRARISGHTTVAATRDSTCRSRLVVGDLSRVESSHTLDFDRLLSRQQVDLSRSIL
ncbi:hypothetical protein K438DRAFT_1774610 [Mycena galopus ATCC 62051]|nr:hypothetical protein K438DRAFT_1774610 [Mycena galopus ATCC 62051]